LAVSMTCRQAIGYFSRTHHCRLEDLSKAN
jgi:hypothetical protein